MAHIDKYILLLLKLEGGIVNDPADHGGLTNMDVTLSSWRQMGFDKNGDGQIDAKDISLLTPEDVTALLKTHYWDRWHGDEIRDQKLANILVDWALVQRQMGDHFPDTVTIIKERLEMSIRKDISAEKKAAADARVFTIKMLKQWQNQKQTSLHTVTTERLATSLCFA